MKRFLEIYLAGRPLFLALIRAKEAVLYEKYLPLKKPILDVGCGDGFFAKLVFGKTDVGIDLIDSRMDQAREKDVYKKIVEFNGVNIPLNSSWAQTIVCNCTLEHVEKLQPLLNEIYRVLKPGGKFLTTVMAKPWEDNLVGSMVMGTSYALWMKKKQMHLNLLSENEWRAMFKRCGFKTREEIGYLSSSACKWLDGMHYLSLPSLISYKLTGRWVMWPNVIPLPWLENLMKENVIPEKSGAIFWCFEK